MLDLYAKLQTPLVAVQEVPDEDLPRYGITLPATDDYLCCLAKGFVEKPKRKLSPANLAIIGRYILSPAIFPLLDKATPGLNGEIQLTDSLNLLAQTEKIYAYRFYGTRFDVGDKLGFILANLTFALQRPELRTQLLRHLDDLTSSQRFKDLLKIEESQGEAPKTPAAPPKKIPSLPQASNQHKIWV
jgi:UTP--glucose-1-phosphate uridylyltransferase